LSYSFVPVGFSLRSFHFIELYVCKLVLLTYHKRKLKWLARVLTDSSSRDCLEFFASATLISRQAQTHERFSTISKDPISLYQTSQCIYTVPKALGPLSQRKHSLESLHYLGFRDSLLSCCDYRPVSRSTVQIIGPGESKQ
jgi:hypothetical protein